MPKPYIPNDAWSKKAVKEGFRARSVYKLMELDEKFGLLKPGMTVLDLGAAPGSWLQYTSRRIGAKGRVIGIDLTFIEPIEENVFTHEQDITDVAAVSAVLDEAKITAVDLVLSDIAPATSGIRDVDQWRSIELNQAVVDIALRFLKPGGVCVLKVFRGADFDTFLFKLKQTWARVKPAHVAASRDRSKEIYIVLWKK